MHTEQEIENGTREGTGPATNAGARSADTPAGRPGSGRGSRQSLRDSEGSLSGDTDPIRDAPRTGRLRRGTELRVCAEQLDERGHGVARPPGYACAVHVAGLLPGETARVAVRHVPTDRGRDSGRRVFAEVLRRESAASARVTPACAGYGRCGGCTLQHLAEAEQLQFKTEQLTRALSAVLRPAGAGPSPETEAEAQTKTETETGVTVRPCVPSPSALYYRSRVKLVAAPSAAAAAPDLGHAGGSRPEGADSVVSVASVILGSYAPRSHRVVEMAGCRVNARALTAVGRTLASLWSRAGLPVFQEGAGRSGTPRPEPGQRAVAHTLPAPAGATAEPPSGGLRYVLLREVRSGAIQISLVLGAQLPRTRLAPIVDGLRAAHPKIESVVLHINPTRSNTLLPALSAPERAVDAAPADAPEAEDALGPSAADHSLLGPMYLWEELSYTHRLPNTEYTDTPSDPDRAGGPTRAAGPAQEDPGPQPLATPLRLRVSARSFLQVNRELAARLYSDAARALKVRPDETILDLYCGVSGLGRTVLRTQPGARLIGIEWSPSAIEDAQAAAAADGVTEQTRFLCGGVVERLPEVLRSLRGPWVALLNPPRRGCEPAVLEALCTGPQRPRAIGYVSCSPQSLARDLAVLLAAGYRLDSVTPYDMHPGTPHIETLAVLSAPA